MNTFFEQVLKGNIRFLFSPNSDVRNEAAYRLIWLLGREKDSGLKMPRIATVHNFSLSCACIFDRQPTFRKTEGCYQVI